MGSSITIQSQFLLALGLLKCILFTSEKAHPERKKPKSNRINNSLVMVISNLWSKVN